MSLDTKLYLYGLLEFILGNVVMAIGPSEHFLLIIPIIVFVGLLIEPLKASIKKGLQ